MGNDTLNTSGQEIEYGFCQCGCGQKTNLAPYTSPKLGWIRGEPRRYVSGHNFRGRRDDTERFWSHVNVGSSDECWEWNGQIATTGYGAFAIPRKGSARSFHPIGAHRFSYELTYGPIPEGMCVLHSCDNRKCVNPSHLRIGTKGDNNRDTVSHGRTNPVSGEGCSWHKVTEGDVVAIRTEYATGTISMAALGVKYGLSIGSIHMIIHRRNWKHVP